MQRRKFSREFKIEAVRLVPERGVSVAQASRAIAVHENVVRKWVKEFGADPKPAFPGHGQLIPKALLADSPGDSRIAAELIQVGARGFAPNR